MSRNKVEFKKVEIRKHIKRKRLGKVKMRQGNGHTYKNYPDKSWLRSHKIADKLQAKTYMHFITGNKESRINKEGYKNLGEYILWWVGGETSWLDVTLCVIMDFVIMRKIGCDLAKATFIMRSWKKTSCYLKETTFVMIRSWGK